MKETTTVLLTKSSAADNYSLPLNDLIAFKIAITCPYCKTMATYYIEGSTTSPSVLLCPIEDKGCDRYFVARIGQLEAKLEVRKIEVADA